MDVVLSAVSTWSLEPTVNTAGVEAAVAESNAPLAVYCPLPIALVSGSNWLANTSIISPSGQKGFGYS